MTDLLFVLSKLVWLLVMPDTLLALALLGGMALVWSGRPRAGHWLLGLAAGFVLLLLLPIPERLMAVLETRFPAPHALPDRIDGIVLLGGHIALPPDGEPTRPELNAAADRLIGLAELARAHPEARLVFTGGTGAIDGGPAIEAIGMPILWRSVGSPGRPLEIEGASRNTWENAVFTRTLVDPRPGQTWVLVTSAWHMPRSIGVFRAAGWPEPIPWPVDRRSGPGLDWWNHRYSDGILGGPLGMLRIGLREVAGLLAYRLLGRVDAFWPGPLPETAS